MRVYRLALISGVAVLVACGGGKAESTADSAATASTATGTGASATASANGTGAPAPITGATVEVKMLQDAQGNFKYEPADIAIKSGDGVKFIMVSGGPHNVAFDPAQVPANAKAQLATNMPQQVSELSSPMMMNPNENYTISFGNIPPGKYDFHCTPHLAMGMRGTITVE